MAGYKPTVRTVLNRERLHEVDFALAKGLELLAMEVLNTAKVPDQPVIGEGLVEAGGFISYVDGKRIGGDVQKKPKAMKVRGRGIVVGVGYDRPARFQEMGTVHQPPRPFLTPAVIAVTGNQAVVVDAIKTALDQHLTKKGAKLARLAKKGPGVPSGRSVPARAVGHPLEFGDFVDLNVPLGTKKG
jgi:hypothetical protein